jgi:hypothetical protein
MSSINKSNVKTIGSKKYGYFSIAIIFQLGLIAFGFYLQFNYFKRQNDFLIESKIENFFAKIVYFDPIQNKLNSEIVNGYNSDLFLVLNLTYAIRLDQLNLTTNILRNMLNEQSRKKRDTQPTHATKRPTNKHLKTSESDSDEIPPPKPLPPTKHPKNTNTTTNYTSTIRDEDLINKISVVII